MALSGTQAGADIYRRPAELLQNLIRFDTTNPPGNEIECVQYVRDLLAGIGVESRLYARIPSRPNLVARIEGRGDAPPLLLQGHVDVVTTEHQEWSVPPFEGREADGQIWGRGALDMKGGVAMMLAAFMRARVEGLRPAGDVILCVLSDEEAGGDYGAKWLVESHPEEFAGVKYAIGEFGGLTLHLGGARLYPIMVAEKQLCTLRATFSGPGGHGSVPMRGGAMSKLGRALTRLEERRLPVHIAPVFRAMVDTITGALPPEVGGPMRGLLDERTADAVLGGLGEIGRSMEAQIRNTANATIVHGGHSVNVIPSEIVLDIDGRLLPGVKPDQMLLEMRGLLGDDLDVELEVVRFDMGPENVDLALFDMLAGIIRELDPGSIPFPHLLSGVTDGRHFARLGIQTYGFLPMRLPPGINFASSISRRSSSSPSRSAASSR
jgi:acetylornithine deacetylase/succinyl-diaminopimelate desuccinylase-like protein